MVLEGRLELADDAVALGRGRAEWHEVVVVEVDPPRADLGELRDGAVGVRGGARRVAERVAAGVADRPEAEAELVGGLGSVGVQGSS